MITRLNTAPTAEPVTLLEAKFHLRLATVEAQADQYIQEDDLLNSLIQTATILAQNFTRRALMTQTWDGYLQSFPETIRLPFPPAQAVTSILVEGVSFTDFQVTTEGILSPADGYSWPSLSSAPGPDPIVITWDAGYGSAAADVPVPIRQAMLLIIGHLYANREATVPGISMQVLPWGSELLMNPYRWIEIP